MKQQVTGSEFAQMLDLQTSKFILNISGPYARGVWGGATKTPEWPKIYQKGPHCLHKQNPRQLYHAIIVGPEHST